jgi:hypothetical protein
VVLGGLLERGVVQVKRLVDRHTTSVPQVEAALQVNPQDRRVSTPI